MRTTNGLIALFLFGFITQNVFAEGSFQTGLNQPLQEESNAYGFPQYVDVLTVGEVINVSVCGVNSTDDISVQIFDPDNISVLNTTLTDGNVSCTDAFTAPLTNPLRYTSTKTGAYEVRLNNTAAGGREFDRFDISITPNTGINPDPTDASGRLWAYQWGFYTGTFDEADATDADYFPLVPGGRASTNYVWKLDLNKFSGNRYVLSANDLGVDAPNSGYSVLAATNTVTPKFPIYVAYPDVANPRPTDPPVINSFRFIDSAGQDYAITPGITTPLEQDTGFFEFVSDADGTYSITIDTNSDGIYGAGDKLLLGTVTAGVLESVEWDGTDVSGAALPLGTYRSFLQLRLGEYHFIADDAETSGGGVADGLTIYLANSDGSTTDTLVYWDDATFLGATTTLPDGALSSTPAGKHTWGDFTGAGIGDLSYVDTYVYGLASASTALSAISGSDALLTGVDGSVDMTPVSAQPGSPLGIAVTDSDLNIIPTFQENIYVVVTNTRTGEIEQISLTEDSINSALFNGALPTLDSAATGTGNDGTMNVQFGDVLTVTYVDQLDSVGASVNRTDQSTLNDFDGNGSPDDPDGDLIPNQTDIDDDNDGIPDTLEGNGITDTDGDGVVDSLDLDSDNDGLFDLHESGADAAALDTNNDGIIDAANTVGVNGLADAVETSADSGTISYNGGAPLNTDGDTVADFRDLDTDNDGIPDVIEAGGIDGDGDGVVGTGVPAVDANGVPTAGAGLLAPDTDGDLVPDQRDLDADGDGLFDLVEAGGPDTDNNGLVDGFTDIDGDGFDDDIAASALPLPDSNGNGTPDYLEQIDSDNDGIPNTTDIDDDNDGIPDTFEGNGIIDTDGDGIVDSLDLDSDNDGLFDLHESGADAAVLDINNDGIIDVANIVGTNGLADAVETSADSGTISYNSGTPLNTDGDTVADFRDLDTDNDGIPDVIEAGGVDGDGDGVVGTGVPAVDVNGVPTSGAGLLPPDTDGDGTTNQRDLDADGDGVFDLVEAGGPDTDNNGLVDGFTDIDGDGFDDDIAASALPLPDSSGNGTPDYLDNTDTDGDGIPDTADIDDDNDSIPDSLEGSGVVDTDSDGIDDSLDLDSDNDGLFDLHESGADAAALDTNNDGIIDVANTVGTNGLADAVETSADSGTISYNSGAPLNTDGDTVADFRDLDTDNDGIPDVIEAGGIDGDGDGIVGTGIPAVDGNGVPTAGAGLLPPDTDGDLVPDQRDLDADGDNLFDLVEAGGPDTNNDGLVDDFTDIDGDGFDDGIAASPLPLTDTNGNGTPDYLENTDGDGDGLPNSIDIDDDNDGIPDSLEGDGVTDTDSDGVVDSLDLDSDNDGLFDLHESGADATALDTDNDGRIDAANTVGTNGLADSVETSADSGTISYNSGAPLDTDGDTVADFRDLDTDNDGIPDVIEAGGNDADEDGMVGTGVPTVDGNGVPTSGAGLLAPDTDTDGVTDQRDLDADGDGLYDLVEAGGVDTDNDGLVDGFSDSNSDGFDDSVINTALPLPDTDADGVIDYRDLDSDNDGISDVIESGGLDPNGDGLVGPAPQAVDVNGVYTGGALTALDTDGDGVDNQLDLDSDNDGIPDVIEAGGPDADGDGIVGSGTPTVDALGIPNGTSLIPVDTDGDTQTDPYDIDADNDGIFDLVEAGGPDTNNDGLVDGFTDLDGDGFDDLIKITALPLPDTDGDSIPDFQDTDDVDNDGVPDSIDIDDDNDGIPDSVEGDGLVDTDGDGIVDSRDLDSDNDGLLDLNESGVPAPETLDTDNNGVIDNTNPVGVNGLADIVETPADSGAINYNGGVVIDTDSDGVADFRDLDSDNDSIPDVIESGGDDPDTDGILGTGTPVVNNNGLTTGSGLPPIDTDGDGDPDHRDLDSDNDGKSDLIEAGAPDVDDDGLVDGFTDLDGDGFDDAVAAADLPLTDTDGDGTPDYQDTNDSVEVIHTGLDGVGSVDIWLLMLLLPLVLFARRVSNRASKVALVSTLAMTPLMVNAVDELNESDSKGFFDRIYVGAGIGQSLMAPETKGTMYSIDDDKDSAYRIYLGMDLNDHLSAELSLANLGTTTLQPTGEIDYEIISLDGLYYFYDQYENDHKGWASYIKAGLGSIDNSANVPYIRDNSVQISFGLGAEYAWNNGFAARADLESYDDDAAIFTVGLLYRFGSQSKSAVQSVAALQLDSDNDGVFDDLDKCPGTPAALSVRDQACEADTDRDGVLNDYDQCPNTIIGASVNATGCAVFERKIEGINFQLASANLTEQSKYKLDETVSELLKLTEVSVEIQAHTDSQGTNENNQSLSQARAESVANYLVSKGISRDRLVSKGYGESQPLVSNRTIEGRAQNRRVELRVIKTSSTTTREECSAKEVPTVVDSHGCELDTDKDGVVDRLDQCPSSVADATVDSKGCDQIVVDTDSDGDGVIDRLDQCPGTVYGTGVNATGCAVFETRIEGINFKLASAELTGTSKTKLNQAADALLKNPSVRIEIQAHTDSQGTNENNLNLSQARANSVADYLASRGVDRSRMEARGYGEERPLVSNRTIEGRAQNRRVEFRVLGTGMNLQ